MRPSLLGLDLDGTLLDGRSRLSPGNRAALDWCGRAGIRRAVVTGRSLFSARTVMEAEFPVDYLLFSSGAGLVTWPGCRLLHRWQMPDLDARAIARILLDEDLAFMAHRPVPRTHEFCYHEGANRRGDDFVSRVERYRPHTQALRGGLAGLPSGLSFFLVMLQPDMGYFERLVPRLSRFGSVVRSTSPIDGQSLWLEVYPRGVCKGSGLSWLSRLLLVPDGEVAVVGNDYNDLGMLQRFERAYVVGNAPEALRRAYPLLPDNEHNPLAELVRPWQSGPTCP
ncbi:MAG: hypothetical protein CSA07_00380 [Bacteroidia bacterium]|nr:MAG: hypothetical protein CSA07_00380 [Bacteroidia bacterium]